MTTTAHYQKIERGTFDPRLSAVVKWAEAVRVTLSEVLRGIYVSRVAWGRWRTYQVLDPLLALRVGVTVPSSMASGAVVAFPSVPGRVLPGLSRRPPAFRGIRW